MSEKSYNEKKECVFSESSDAAGEANDVNKAARNDEDEGWIEGDLRELAQVRKHVLLRPGPQTNRQHQTTKYLEKST